MTTKPDPTNIDDSVLDRLVDGELPEKERQKLLAGLDHVPNGWRRCALAFLESQCWKQTFGALTEKPAVAPPTPELQLRPRSVWPGRLQTLAAMAASFLVAFWIGSLFQGLHLEQAGKPEANQIATTAPLPKTTVQYASPEPVRTIRPTPNPQQLVTVSLPNNTAHGHQAMQLPAEERSSIDRQWLNKVPEAMPENVRQAFARSGHQVDQHRELVPVPLKDGRNLVVPVDQVDVHYVSNKY